MTTTGYKNWIGILHNNTAMNLTNLIHNHLWITWHPYCSRILPKSGVSRLWWRHKNLIFCWRFPSLVGAGRNTTGIIYGSMILKATISMHRIYRLHFFEKSNHAASTRFEEIKTLIQTTEAPPARIFLRAGKFFLAAWLERPPLKIMPASIRICIRNFSASQ